MNVKEFNSLSNKFNKLAALGIEFDIGIDSLGYGNGVTYTAHAKNFVLDSCKTIALIIGNTNVKLRVNDISKLTVAPLKNNYGLIGCVSFLRGEIGYSTQKSEEANVKFFPARTLQQSPMSSLYDEFYNLTYLITKDPIEVVEEDITYRSLIHLNEILFSVPHTDPRFKYLDKGHIFVRGATTSSTSVSTIAITSVLTLDTYLCLLACSLDASLLSQLQDSCYVNPNTAKITRVKMEKAMKPEVKVKYSAVAEGATKEFLKFNDSNIMSNFLASKTGTATFNRIKFTKTKASYEGITIEHPLFLENLQRLVAFDGQMDIYNILEAFAQHMKQQLQPNYEAALAKSAPGEEVVASDTIIINGMSVTLSRTNRHERRMINGHQVNVAEIVEAICQAACYTNERLYDAFLGGVSELSLARHKLLLNGMPVKIHKQMTALDYAKPTAGYDAPKLNFRKTKKHIELVLNAENSVRIRFSEIISKVKRINQRCSNASYYGYDENGNQAYKHRNADWAVLELQAAIRSATTYPVKTVNEGGDVTIDEVCGVTEAQLALIPQLAIEHYESSLIKSEKFLAMAVKATGAVNETFLNEPCYIVEGKLSKYAVNIKNNTVYFYDSKQSICIVEAGHHVIQGNDALATRLYALKNDEHTVNHIKTLKRHS